jgi:hypothetical protein
VRLRRYIVGGMELHINYPIPEMFQGLFIKDTNVMFKPAMVDLSREDCSISYIGILRTILNPGDCPGITKRFSDDSSRQE